MVAPFSGPELLSNYRQEAPVAIEKGRVTLRGFAFSESEFPERWSVMLMHDKVTDFINQWHSRVFTFVCQAISKGRLTLQLYKETRRLELERPK
jgi:hypothetical protein